MGRFFDNQKVINLRNSYLVNQQTSLISEIPPTSTTKKLLLIDNRIKDIETIINSMNENTYCIVFNYFYDTYDTLLSKIRFLNGSNRYILDNFFYEEPELPVRKDSEGNHCTTCDDFSIDDLVLSHTTLQSEYLAHLNDPTTSLWEFHNDSTSISIQKPIFFQRAKKVETTEVVSNSSSIVPLKHTNILSNVQNTYIDGNDMYVASNSLPSRQITLDIKESSKTISMVSTSMKNLWK